MKILSERVTRYINADIWIYKVDCVDLALLYPHNYGEHRGLIGIDPGTVHIGIAYIPQYSQGNEATCIQVDTPNSRDPILRMLWVRDILKTLFKSELPCPTDCKATVEGSSFSDKYRQVELAEARAVAALFLHDAGAVVGYASPLAVYKRVHGSGKLASKHVWKDFMEPDAASALGCALYGGMA